MIFDSKLYYKFKKISLSFVDKIYIKMFSISYINNLNDSYFEKPISFSFLHINEKQKKNFIKKSNPQNFMLIQFFVDIRLSIL